MGAIFHAHLFQVHTSLYLQPEINKPSSSDKTFVWAPLILTGAGRCAALFREWKKTNRLHLGTNQTIN